jgi:purine-cytosine permease-like protein
MPMDAIDVQQLILAYLWYIILGIVCVTSFIFGYRKAAAVCAFLLVLLVAMPILKETGAMLRRMF